MQSNENYDASTTTGSEMGRVKRLVEGTFGFYHNAIKWGIVAGLFMGAYLLIIQIFNGDNVIALGFLQYLILFLVLGMELKKYKQYASPESFYQKGIALGAVTSFIAAITIVLVDVIAALISNDLAFGKFGLYIDGPGNFMVIGGAIALETLVFGMICTFIWLQYLKSRSAVSDRGRVD